MAEKGQLRTQDLPRSASPSDSHGPFPNSDLERKRARDRKSQQAMRDRTKHQLRYLNEQIQYLSQILEERDASNTRLHGKVQSLESELEQIKIENGALRLRLMGQPLDSSPAVSSPWQVPVVNSPPGNMADQIIQNFMESKRPGTTPSSVNADCIPTVCADIPNLSFFVDRTQRPVDELSTIVGDIVLSYKEIDTLPKQVCVFHTISCLLRWQLLLDEESWNQLPSFMRPTQRQLTTPHAAWIDRIPWPRVRTYLIENPSITLDTFATVYSTNFDISWAYEPRHVLLTASVSDAAVTNIIINPVFQEHVHDIRNWHVSEAFRARLPEVAELIDADTKSA